MTVRTMPARWWRMGLALLLLLMTISGATVAGAFEDTTPPQVDPGCTNGCEPWPAEAGQPATFEFGYSDDVGVTSCTFYVDEVARGDMTLSNPGGMSGFASAMHAFTTLGAHTVGVTCEDEAGNVGGGTIARDVNVVDTTPPQVDPGCTNGCEPLPAEAGQPTTFTFGYADFVGVTGCTFYVDEVAEGEMTLTDSGGTSGFASATHAFTTLGAHTIGITCEDTSGNVGGGPFAQNVNVVDTTPPDTTITTAVDGNGDIVANGGSTLSDAITFTFTGTDFVGVSGFECSLDGEAFSACTSPMTYTALASGTHTFKVRAIDTSSNVDPTPASFTWSILTPAQAIQNLVKIVKSLNLQQGIDNSLDAKLDAALKALDDIKQNNDAAAINSLKAFIQEVKAQRGKSLTDTQADLLINTAQAIIDSLSSP